MSSGALAVIAVLSGIFVLAAVISDWKWFFEHPKAKFFVDAFGRNGARILWRARMRTPADRAVLPATAVL